MNHKRIRKQLEILNIAIGIVLIAISLIYFFADQIDYFASWFIFGCMYIVMDFYGDVENITHQRIRLDIFKYFINIAALIVSLFFLISII